jgi:hypothetical protein
MRDILFKMRRFVCREYFSPIFWFHFDLLITMVIPALTFPEMLWYLASFGAYLRYSSSFGAISCLSTSPKGCYVA